MDVTESIQTAPIVYDGVMYVTSSFNHLFAIDAKSGKELWRYEHVMAPAVSLCCGPNNRGVEALDGLVYMGTLDSRIVALDARTGAVVWSTQIADPLRGYSITMAPTVVAGKVLIGLAGAEYGVRGALKALDAKTGNEIWTFYRPRRTRSACGRRRMRSACRCIEISPRKKPRWQARRSLQDTRRLDLAEPLGRSRDPTHLFRRGKSFA